jgi:hypothetical protein
MATVNKRFISSQLPTNIIFEKYITKLDQSRTGSVLLVNIEKKI